MLLARQRTLEAGKDLRLRFIHDARFMIEGS
jgi:hypothetical protein